MNDYKEQNGKDMVAEIISVGTELLLGDTVNTNAAFLSRELAALGISVFTQTVVGDNPQRLLKAYDQAFERGADLIITIGGLGPTEDDITKEIAAEYFDYPLILHEPAWESITQIFKKINPNQQITSNNQKQAMIPEGSHVFLNPNGTAPGIYMEKDNKKFIMLPGPPNELIPMFLELVAPFLKKQTNKILVSKVLKIAGMGESMVEHRIKDVLNGQKNPTIAPYAKTAEVWLRVTAYASDEAEAISLIKPVTKQLRDILGEVIYGEDEDSLESVAIAMLKERGMTIALAESCTGGLLCAKLINQPGVSEVLLEGITAYANESKVKRLGVDEALITAHGAVSHEVAAAMAEGAAKYSGADVSLSVTGIAGPAGGSKEKPVGRVYIGLYIRGKPTRTKELNITGDRMKVRSRAVINALDFLRLSLMEDE